MAFKGLRVFISRKDFPPQFIDSAQDMVRENGAEICICSNISCNASTDFHVLPSSEHEKVAEYLNNGCNVIGPDCLVGCAKEHRSFPRQGYTCCLAMEGVRVLATGFEKEEKVKIEKIVKSMCGEIETKALTNVSFVIAKDVLAAKYKFAVNNLRRPILKIDWLLQCWREHRLVPCERFRLPPFIGLTICATNIPLDERKRIEDACVENGGSYSADLTKKCTHLIANAPQGDKFRVARRWGTIRIVNRQWFEQCLAAKACLDEDLFPVNAGKEKAVTVSQVSGPPPYISPVENIKPETVTSSAISVVSNTIPGDQALLSNSGVARAGSSLQDDEQSIPSDRNENSMCDDDNNMYLSNCRVYFSGFSALVLRKYVNMVRDGGGTRFMEFNDRVTHVIIGDSIESSEKEFRRNSCMGTIHFVRPVWLEECYQQRKEALVAQKHLLPDGSFEKKVEYGSQDRSGIEGMHPPPSGKQQLSLSHSSELEVDKSASYQQGIFGKQKYSSDRNMQQHASQQLHAADLKEPGHSSETKSLCGSKGQLEVVNSITTKGGPGPSGTFSSISIFQGYTFAICDSFPMERRAEIVQWVIEGGGMMETQNSLQKDAERKTDFLVVTHGYNLASSEMAMNVKPVSSHWIRFCLEEKRLLDLNSHVLYRPLQCQVPFPGLKALRFCVSQYEEKDRLLLRNLCFVLGVKFTEKLNKKVTHLLCKVKDGQKYHAACNWGIDITTADWLFACVSKDKILPVKDFQPRELSAAEKGLGLGMTQGPSRGVCPSLGETCSELPAVIVAKKGTKRSAKSNGARVDASVVHLAERNSYFLSLQTTPSQEQGPFLDPWDEQTAQWSGGDDAKNKIAVPAKTMHTSLDDDEDSSNPKRSQTYCRQYGNEDASLDQFGDPQGIEQPMVTENGTEIHHSSDVAAAIEGLLAQTSNLQGNTGLGSFSIDQQISPEYATLKRTREDSCYKRPKLQEMSTEKRVALKSPSRDLPVFEESQMESQVIGYDEDHTGKQLIIERVRTRSMSTTTDHLSRPAGKEAAAWRNDGLGRLFKVAEANK